MCGEKLTLCRFASRQMGSPPRVRGKGEKHYKCSTGIGITPACAGKRKKHSRDRIPHGDHPRVCGEKSLPEPAERIRGGSPPRVRGKAFLKTPFTVAQRITPACAGKSIPAEITRRPIRDHPRVCGEKQAGDDDGALGEGITPACAGKRRGCCCRIRAGGDHPRVCGEKLYEIDGRSYFWGSPPRVRGKGKKETESTFRQRITPACAGKSNLVGFRLELDQDHPRVCGEKTRLVACFCSLEGSPPRVRGKD